MWCEYSVSLHKTVMEHLMVDYSSRLKPAIFSRQWQWTGKCAGSETICFALWHCIRLYRLSLQQSKSFDMLSGLLDTQVKPQNKCLHQPVRTANQPVRTAKRFEVEICSLNSFSFSFMKLNSNEVNTEVKKYRKLLSRKQ